MKPGPAHAPGSVRRGVLSAVPRGGFDQSGQALIEAVAALLALLVLFTAMSWIARFQDMALQAGHASRFAAFSLARGSAEEAPDTIRRHYFSGPSHQWADRRGRPLLSGQESEVSMRILPGPALAAEAQPGGGHPQAGRLRHEWLLEDGAAAARVIVMPRPPGVAPRAAEAGGPTRDWLSPFDLWYPALSRHTSILYGAGHAPGDQAAQTITGGSVLAWRDSATRSYHLGRDIQRRAQPIDAGWSRPDPVFDWLQPWAEAIPDHHLRDMPKD